MRFLYVVQILCLFFTHQLYADLIGSTTLVTLSVFKNFPQNPLLAANEIRGFTIMGSGFSLANSSTDCLFNAYFPVSGPVNLNGGTLNLSQDLIFAANSDFQSSGIINGNGYSIRLSPSASSLPSNATTLNNMTLFLQSDVTLQNSLTVQGTVTINGGGHALTVGSNGSLVVSSNAQLILQDIKLYNVRGTVINCATTSGSIILDDAALFFSDDFRFSKGSIFFKKEVSFEGAMTFTLDTAQTSIVNSKSKLKILDNVQLYMGRTSQASAGPLLFTDETSCLHLSSCILTTTNYGFLFTKGSCYVDGNVTLESLGTTTSSGIIIGSGSISDDVSISIAPGAAVKHVRGYWVYNNALPHQIISPSKHSRLIRSEASRIYVPQNLYVNDLTIELDSNTITPLEVENGKQVLYTNASVRFPELELDISAMQLNAYTYRLYDAGFIFLTKGTLPLVVLINGLNNQLYGNGTVSGPIILEGASSVLSMGLNGYLNNGIYLNNGLLLLQSSLTMLENGAFYGPGKINLQKNHIIHKEQFSAQTPLCFQGDLGAIVLHENVSLLSTWTIQGHCKLIGNGSTIDLGDTGAIFIDDKSRLDCKNIRIIGIHDQNISCSSASSVLQLENSDLVLDGNFTFSHGSINFVADTYVSGNYAWFYESDQTSTIQPESRLILWDGLSLRIGRTRGNEPLSFAAKTSKLKFDDSSLYVRNTGMHLKKGCIICSRNVIVDVDSTSTANGVIFGDGNPDNDMELQLSAACTTRFIRGHMTYNMATDKGITSKSNTAQMIRLAASSFYLKHDLQLADLTIDVSPYAQLQVDPNVELRYTKGVIKNQQDEFEISAQWYNPYTMLLDEDGLINLKNGTMPLYLLVSGQSNKIEGNGNLGGLITLMNASSKLIFNFNGLCNASPHLNGGSIFLMRDVVFAGGVQPIGPGLFDITSRTITLGENDLNCNTDIHWKADDGVINIRSHISLSATWTIEGNCTIKGNGHTIDLRQGNIYVAPHSTLRCQNIRLNNVTRTGLRCADNSSDIVLSNVDIIPGSDDSYYLFDKGSMMFDRKVNITGSGIFAYESSQTSTIGQNAALKFDAGITFSCYPSELHSKALVCEDETASCILNSASLLLSISGLEFTKGTLAIKGDVQVFCEEEEYVDDNGDTKRIAKGLICGGQSSDEDCTLQISSGSRLNIVQGPLTCNNVNLSSYIFENTLSSIVMYPFTTLILNNSIDVGSGQLLLDKKTFIRRNNESLMYGSVSVGTVV